MLKFLKEKKFSFKDTYSGYKLFVRENQDFDQEEKRAGCSFISGP